MSGALAQFEQGPAPAAERRSQRYVDSYPPREVKRRPASESRKEAKRREERFQRREKILIQYPVRERL